jgi:hypothetical protein
MIRFLRLAPSALPLLACALAAFAEDASLRQNLEHTFSDWRAAIATHNLPAWQQNTATYRQVLTRNLIVSQKQPYPQALFDFPLRAPETGTLRFVKAEANGVAANLIYFGKVDLGIPDADVPENLLVLKFVSESGKWKFDTMRLINLQSAPEVRASLKNGGSTGFLNGGEFMPDAILPPTPKLCPAPEYVAALQVTSLGYTTTATVNGFTLPAVSDSAEQHVIIGGLRQGENSLTIEVKQTPVAEGSARHFEVNAIVKTGVEKKPAIRVFNWKPPGETSPSAYTEHKIYVNKITLQGQ